MVGIVLRKAVFRMVAWEQQLLQSVDGLSEQYRQPLLDMVKIFIRTIQMREMAVGDEVDSENGRRKLGVAKGRCLIADGYDFDESNAEIASMFGVDL